ncbi:TOMM precursor leader peptide-binding protein [Streptomyces sp. enrichment culture]|uniref:TOMM precursor leader peptide-binding protein n=1 Tax=Streptomyces sp. enrichment culture TaxID=1795815 RepID=UPI003F547EA8
MSTTPYEETADTRPRVRRDVLFTETPGGVIFHNADGGFQVTSPSAYRFATLLVPHLDGSRTVAEICAGFKDPQKAMVGGLVKALYTRGFARSVPAPPGADGGGGASAEALPPAVADRFAQQIAYIDHYADGAERAFAAFRGTRVAVLGDGQVARWAALSLIRNGCASVAVEESLATGYATARDLEAVRAEAARYTAQGSPAEVTVLPGTGAGPGREGWAAFEGYDVVVAACGRDAFRTAVGLLGAGVPEGRVLLPAWTFGGRAVVGPLTTGAAGDAAGTAGCVACAALRLGANGGAADAAVAAELWSGLALDTGGGTAPRGPLAAMLGNLLGYEVFRLVTGALPAETRGQVLVQDMASFDVLAERLLPHPRCPFCRPAQALAEAVDLTAAPPRPVFEPVVAAAPDDDATEGPLAELDRRALALRPSVGVFTRYADEPVTQTPLKVGAVEVGLGAAGTRTVAAFDVQHTAGARLRALDAAAAVYAEHVVPAVTVPASVPGTPPGAARADAPEADRADRAGRGVRAQDHPLPRVSPDALTTASGVGGDPVAGWVAGTSLLTKKQVLVPAGAVRPFGPDNQDRRFEPSRAGAGAGGSLPEAAAAGLLSALAHDALRRSVRGAGRVAPLASAEVDGDAEAVFLLRSAGHMGLDVELLDLGEADRSGVSVVLARTRPDASGPASDAPAAQAAQAAPGEAAGPVPWAVGAALDRTAAAVDALRDLLGTVQLAAEGVLGEPDTGDPLLADLDAALVPVTAGPGTAGPPPAPVSWPDVLERLAAAERDAMVVPTHAADLPAAGIHTVRVLLTKAADDDD